MRAPRIQSRTYFSFRDHLQTIDPALPIRMLSQLARHAVDAGLVYENAKGKIAFVAPANEAAR